MPLERFTLIKGELFFIQKTRGEPMKSTRRHRRGYPVTLLIGFSSDGATLWQIFSHVAKQQQIFTLNGNRNDRKALYNFHETIVNTLKLRFKEGIRSVILVTPAKTRYNHEFLDHIHRHHTYMLQGNTSERITFVQLEGEANRPHEVATIVKTLAFQRSKEEATSTEANSLIKELEKIINSSDQTSLTLYSLREIENAIYHQDADRQTNKRHLILTDQYLQNSAGRKRINRLIQISTNKKVETRIINSQTSAGKRISQFGGIVLFDMTRPTKQACREENEKTSKSAKR
jgi:stalled ribosome rescue protein Dom34